ncbi:MAG: LLM class flavin-dependent oxidoreductase [Dehalococcoidia bacterium]
MEFGTFDQIPCAEDQSPVDRYADVIAQARLADQLGFDSVWLAELHFNPRFSVMPAPLVLGGAIAQATSNIRIAAAVHLLPLHYPVRIAEEIATLDVLSGGRAIFGTGRGAQLRQYMGYGVDIAEGRERFLEGLEVVIKAWTDEEISHRGKYFEVEGVQVVPKPCQQPHPPIYIAANSPDTFGMVGELGHSILVAPIVSTLEGAQAGLAEYRSQLGRNGHDKSKSRVNVNLLVHVTEQEGQSRVNYTTSVDNYLEVIRRNRSRVIARTQQLTTELAFDHYGIMGTPEQCIERLQHFQEFFQPDEIMCWFNPGGLVPREEVARSMELFAREVMPHFQ